MSNRIRLNENSDLVHEYRSALSEVLGLRRAMFGAPLRLREFRDALIQGLDGDGSQDVHYAALATELGTADTAAAHALFLEVDAAVSKFDGTATTAQLTAALDQLNAKTLA